jgi:hypothetical protein
MPLETSQSTQFLLELYRMTQGDGNVQVATQEVGTAIGLDKEAAGKVSENLIGEGLVEIKTLSGGIGISAEGVEAALAAGGQAPISTPQSIGNRPILDAGGKAAAEALIEEVKKHLATATMDYDAVEEMVMDIKTFDMQVGSPQPKTAIVREVLRSLHQNLKKTGAEAIASRLAAAINDPS